MPHPPPSPPPPPPITLAQPSADRHRYRHIHLRRPAKLFRSVRAVFRAFPILTSSHSICSRLHLHIGHSSLTTKMSGSTRTTGTLFGHRKSRITLAIQDNSRSVLILLLELPVPTAKFMTDMGTSGSVRVALECEKKDGDKVRLIEEYVWTACVNGKNVGYGIRREATEEDLRVMQLLHAVSVGAGVIPEDHPDPSKGEMTYMRAYFDRVVGSKDSETFYMSNPDGNSGHELSIFFVRT